MRSTEKQAKKILRYHAKRDRRLTKKELKACKRLKRHYDKYGIAVDDNITWDVFVVVSNYIIDLKARLKQK